jgi:hypothetical protein
MTNENQNLFPGAGERLRRLAQDWTVRGVAVVVTASTMGSTAHVIAQMGSSYGRPAQSISRALGVSGSVTRSELKTQRDISALQELPENWDTYGSPPIAMYAIEGARYLAGLASQSGLPAGRAVPVRGGGIQLEWRLGVKELELEVTPGGAVEFLKVSGDAMSEGALPAYRDSQVSDLMQWLLQTRD